jgi:hypothetical protein
MFARAVKTEHTVLTPSHVFFFRMKLILDLPRKTVLNSQLAKFL